MKLTEFFIKRPTLFWSLAVFMILAGILAFIQRNWKTQRWR